MRPLSLSLAALAAAVLVGCASGPQVNPQITAALAARNVPTSTYDKVNNGQALGYDDLRALVVKKVPTQIIIGYLQSTEKVYNLTYSQMANLKAAGASAQLLNYLSETEGFYGYHPTAAVERSKKQQKDAYYRDALYQDEQPFGYNEPVVDDWYDSAYEESLYSPFSMD